VLVLGNGRRIESGWKFGDAELARLIRVAEAV
jgi:transposase